MTSTVTNLEVTLLVKCKKKSLGGRS